MNCSISGEVPEEPVVSRKSGLLFEKRLIERHISEYGKCPVTGEELTMDDLIPVKAGKTVRPRPMQAASIPGMLNVFQNEWDTVMLSHFSLEKQLHTAREELSHALYQHDAACRVIARLKRERNEARSMLAQAERPIPMSTSASVPAVAVSNGVVENNGISEETQSRPGISEEIVGEITECNLSLSNQRKQRRIPPTLAAVNDVENYTQLASHPLHKTSKPGIVSIDINHAKDIIVTGGVDSAAVIFDRTSGQILSTLSGHSKKVTSVKFVNRDDTVLTASADKTVRIWGSAENGNYMCKHTLRDHSEEQVEGKPEDKGFTSAAFHPDGLILATGTISQNVKIWDVKSQASVTQFAGHKGPITAMSFSENGYYLATAAHDGVRLWDLRKLKNFRVLSPYNEDTPTNSVEFDHSGSYLTIAGSDLRVYQVGNVRSEWDCIKSWPDLSGTGKITGAKFGPDAKYIAVGSMDRNLRIFGQPEGDDTAMES